MKNNIIRYVFKDYMKNNIIRYVFKENYFLNYIAQIKNKKISL